MVAGNEPTSRPAWVYLLVVAVFVLFGFLTNQAGQIEHDPNQTTFPIVAFEVAGSGARAEQILSEAVGVLSVDEVDRQDLRATVEAAVRRSLWWDFGFIIGYSLLIFFLAPTLGQLLAGSTWTRLGRAIGWGGLLAGGLDVIENVSLFQVLQDTSLDTWAFVAAAVSWGKWLLVAVALAFGLIGLTCLGVRRLTSL